MMERLTFEGNFCDIAQCRELPCPYNGACSQRKVWERLKAYEDTGLEPAMCANYKTFEDEAISKDVTFKRIVALMEADRAGRLVVLPCKVGDTVWRIKRTFEEYPDRSKPYIEPSGFLLQDVFNISKTVFLTREEAEKALEAMKDE
jgi:hypothetical protein